MKSATYNYNLGFHNCGDTSVSKHYSISGLDISNGFTISAIFYDSAVPPAISTYTIVNPITTGTLSSGQCAIILNAPSLSSTQFVATGGYLNFDPNTLNPKVTISSIAIINIADTSNTGTLSGNWSCQ